MKKVLLLSFENCQLLTSFNVDNIVTLNNLAIMTGEFLFHWPCFSLVLNLLLSNQMSCGRQSLTQCMFSYVLCTRMTSSLPWTDTQTRKLFYSFLIYFISSQGISILVLCLFSPPYQHMLMII